MAKHVWNYPSEFQTYLKFLENPKYPKFELVEELKVRPNSFNGSGHAWVVRDMENDLVCLQSFATIVSVKDGNDSIDLGKWSQTTTRQQSEFGSWCYNH